jgi:hypothetical protein
VAWVAVTAAAAAPRVPAACPAGARVAAAGIVPRAGVTATGVDIGTAAVGIMVIVVAMVIMVIPSTPASGYDDFVVNPWAPAVFDTPAPVTARTHTPSRNKLNGGEYE